MGSEPGRGNDCSRSAPGLTVALQTMGRETRRSEQSRGCRADAHPSHRAMAESALIVRVPAAEPHVSGLRARFDPAAALGVPAHVTVLYPFVPPDRITAAVLARVRAAI